MRKTMILSRGLLTLGVVLYALLMPLWASGREAASLSPEAAETAPVGEAESPPAASKSERTIQKILSPTLTLAQAPEPENLGDTAATENPTPETPAPENTLEPETPKAREPETRSAPEAVLMGDRDLTVRVLKDGSLREMSLREYLIGVLAGEVPGDFPPEALKAQAVAARTCLLYRMLVEPRPGHPEADTCTDPGCCNAWLDETERRWIWGEQYDAFLASVSQAVDATDGKCLFYGGELILAAYHCASWRATVPCSQVWGAELPYLQSVFTPEDGETVPDYIRLRQVPLEEFWETLGRAFPEEFAGDSLPELRAETDDSGRLLSLRLGETQVTPTRLRQLFSLRSAAFTLELTEDDALFRTRGSGHGVGLSQYGAQELAREGWSWQEILGHYYPGAYPARIVLYR